jgi:hypothetical protein
MDAAAGILTARGGMTSHAAVVARGMGTPCVAGCESIKVDEKAGKFSVNGVTVKEGEFITIDGTTGEVMLGSMPTIEPALTGDFGVLMGWVDKMRTGINADIPRDAKVARSSARKASAVPQNTCSRRGETTHSPEMILPTPWMPVRRRGGCSRCSARFLGLSRRWDTRSR